VLIPLLYVEYVLAVRVHDALHQCVGASRACVSLGYVARTEVGGTSPQRWVAKRFTIQPAQLVVASPLPLALTGPRAASCTPFRLSLCLLSCVGSVLDHLPASLAALGLDDGIDHRSFRLHDATLCLGSPSADSGGMLQVRLNAFHPGR
jgi:hypothetical protein